MTASACLSGSDGTSSGPGQPDVTGVPVIDPDRGADHGETLALFWAIAQEPNRGGVVADLAGLCVVLAELHAPCERNGEKDFAIRRFVKATWAPAYAADAMLIFEAYVKHGVIDVNHVMDGFPVVAIAILNGKIEVAELLVKHGARLDAQVRGLDMLTITEQMFGEFTVTKPSSHERFEAVARLRQASMERQIAVELSESPAMGLDAALRPSGDLGDGSGSSAARRRRSGL